MATYIVNGPITVSMSRTIELSDDEIENMSEEEIFDLAKERASEARLPELCVHCSGYTSNDFADPEMPPWDLDLDSEWSPSEVYPA